MIQINKQTTLFQAKIPNMEKFVLLAVAMALLGSATAGPVLGGAKCTWGPSYWCANIPQVPSFTIIMVFINIGFTLNLQHIGCIFSISNS